MCQLTVPWGTSHLISPEVAKNDVTIHSFIPRNSLQLYRLASTTSNRVATCYNTATLMLIWSHLPQLRSLQRLINRLGLQEQNQC